MILKYFIGFVLISFSVLSLKKDGGDEKYPSQSKWLVTISSSENLNSIQYGINGIEDEDISETQYLRIFTLLNSPLSSNSGIEHRPDNILYNNAPTRSIILHFFYLDIPPPAFS